MYENIYKCRFTLFFITQLFALFGSLLFPAKHFDTIFFPILITLNLAAGILLVSKQKKLMWFLILLFIVATSAFGISIIQRQEMSNLFIRLMIYSTFYIVFTFHIIKQVWRAEFVDQTVIVGVMSGYICLGLIAFLLFMTVELFHPGSFRGILVENITLQLKVDALMYYAYITLMTIGYGEIVPATPAAQKAAVLTGLVGQFYLVIITAIMVGKYIQHSEK